MANWCVNQVDIKGDEEEVARLVALVSGAGVVDGDDGAFLFEKIVPPPSSDVYAINEGQNDFQCGCKDEWVDLTDLPLVEQSRWLNDDKVVEMVPQREKQVNGKKIVREVADTSTIRGVVDSEFGGTELCPDHLVPRNSNHPDWWYNWNVQNWGTKWGARDAWHDRTDNDKIIEGDTSYNFDTAWGPASPVIAALAKQFPKLSITHRYCEGGMGFAGETLFLNGEEATSDEYDSGDTLPEEAWLKEEDGSNSWERDYDSVPMTAFERFCDEHFGGVVGG